VTGDMGIAVTVPLIMLRRFVGSMAYLSDKGRDSDKSSSPEFDLASPVQPCSHGPLSSLKAYLYPCYDGQVWPRLPIAV
jgi:hypothetical protein